MRRLAHLERKDDAQFISGLGNNKLRVIDHCECMLAPLLKFWDALVLEEILGQKKGGETTWSGNGLFADALFSQTGSSKSSGNPTFTFSPHNAAEITTLGSYITYSS